jgi:hypothetical protein
VKHLPPLRSIKRALALTVPGRDDLSDRDPEE